jgi:hypothetical protein
MRDFGVAAAIFDRMAATASSTDLLETAKKLLKGAEFFEKVWSLATWKP